YIYCINPVPIIKFHPVASGVLRHRLYHSSSVNSSHNGVLCPCSSSNIDTDSRLRPTHHRRLRRSCRWLHQLPLAVYNLVVSTFNVFRLPFTSRIIAQE